MNTDLLESMTPMQIGHYVDTKGGVYIGTLRTGTIWRYGKEEFLIPNSDHYADYAARIFDIITSLSIVENRSKLDILTEIRENF